MTELFFNVQIDCESTQRSIDDPGLGERSIRGLGEVFSKTGAKGTFVVIPSDMKVHAGVYRELESEGHEVGLHVHPAEQGYEEFLGVYGFEEQVAILKEAVDQFADSMGRPPSVFTPGYFSANDHTFPALGGAGVHARHGIDANAKPAAMRLCMGRPRRWISTTRTGYNRSLAGRRGFRGYPAHGGRGLTDVGRGTPAGPAH